MTTRKYTSRSQQTTLSSAVTSGAVIIPVVNATNLLGGIGAGTITGGITFTVVIDPDTALEEIVDVTGVSGNNLTVSRAQDMGGASAQDHSAGAVIRHMIIGRDLRESNLHIEATGSYNDGTGQHDLHGLGVSDGNVVGTDKTQTLTNKTLTSPTITNPNITGAGVDASIVFEGATADAYETTLTVVDPTADRTITLPNATGTVVLADATQTLTNKTIDMTGKTLTGLSSAGMSSSSATPKDYVDSILGSATAASTSAASAATSASSAATSASSAATSASNALTSANSAATSATAAATSASSALTSATAAATSATSAAASATAAATSATSAAASATTASNSASAAATSASSAATSQSAAATSATSAAASATAAATSATSASASASAAATSATSASASASAAATSATSASASASAAATSSAAAATSATSAAASATAAATSASSAATSASNALTSANSAATSATAAATSASSALASATAAASSATSAEAAWDSFDDRYLGPKATAPTVDNDGNPLTAGVIYYNTGDGMMYVYSGSAWVVFTSTGDITSVTADSPLTGGGVSGSITVGIQDASTTQKGAVQLTDSTASTSTVTAATPNSVKSAYDLANTAKSTADAAVPQTRTISTTSPLSGGGALSGNLTLSVSAGSTSAAGVLQLTDSTASTSVTTAATPNSVKSAYDLANAAIPKSLVDAKGDILTATADNTPARLAVGTNGQYLKADSTTTSGLAWATVDALPSQTGNAGKYLTTNGTSASWATITTDPTPTVFLLMGA